jgi:hypothetical protein
VRDVEEIVGTQVGEELGIECGIGEVFTGDAGHVDGEADVRQLALAHVDLIRLFPQPSP